MPLPTTPCPHPAFPPSLAQALEELGERVGDFHKHTDLGRISKVVAMVKDIEKVWTLFDYMGEPPLMIP